MPYVLIRHKVKDYKTWKPVFDEHGKMRKSSGSKGGKVFRNYDDPTEVFILLQWDTRENAQKFMKSDEVRETMHHAGVLGQPAIFYLDEVDVPSA